jgi:type I restriction enzyme M protein
MRSIETANPDKLYGIFGDAQWTNKDRLADAMLRDLVEHFSSLELTLANLPEDELGQGYEYLIKKFADDSGHTAAEFYTNRTVVHLMTEILAPQPGESVYDPTCGSGGMLLSCIGHLRHQKKEWRNVHLYGQERNLMTSSIARMNCFLHGIEDFQIVRGDTLSEPKFVEGDRLKQFNVVLANPPYSIKQWDRSMFASDPWGRNLYGTPPQNIADYAFWQHILCSLAPKTGRCAILFPHGILFRDAEKEMRQRIIDADVIECIVGLGPNLFYNSSMPSCVVICRTNKPRNRRGKVLFINAVNEVTREHSQSFLTDSHLKHIVDVYEKFEDEIGFARVVGLEEIRTNGGDLNLPLYVAPDSSSSGGSPSNASSVPESLDAWLKAGANVAEAMNALGGVSADRSRSKLLASSRADILNHKKDWRKVRLGDLVRKTEETERNPLGAGFDRYLLVEHLDAGSLRIRRWGNLADGSLPPTFYKVFRSGQILYPTRNPHLRRAAFANFDGICGEKTLTLSPQDSVDPRFIPFVFQSDAFITFATSRKIGSTNPHVRWRDVAEFEFDLPPLEQQRRIAEILSAVDNSIEASTAQFNMLSELKRAGFEERTLRGESRFPTRPLGEVANFQYGLSCPLNGEGKYPLLRMMNFDEELVVASDLKFADLPSELATAYTLTNGDILFNRTNSADLVGKTGLFQLDGCYLFASYLVRIRTQRNLLLPEFLNFYLNSRAGQAAVRAFATPGVSQSNISAGNLKKVNVPVPSIADQTRVIRELKKIATTTRIARHHLESQRHLLSKITNVLLG